jgi:hypothetical protein
MQFSPPTRPEQGHSKSKDGLLGPCVGRLWKVTSKGTFVNQPVCTLFPVNRHGQRKQFPKQHAWY